MADNKWSQPTVPPPPLFTGEKERNLVKQVNDELIERVIGQQVVYYPIDQTITNYNDLYGEAIEKSFLPPIRVYALVDYQSTETKADESVGIDKSNTITLYFHKRRLLRNSQSFSQFFLHIPYQFVIINQGIRWHFRASRHGSKKHVTPGRPAGKNA